MKRALLVALRAVGVFHALRYWNRRRVAILCYHGVWRGGGDFIGDSMFISKATFARRFDLMARCGYHVVPLERAVAFIKGAEDLPAYAVVLTIDDGWYSTYADMLPELERRNLPATIYCDTSNLLAGTPIPHVMARYLQLAHCDGGAMPKSQTDLLQRATDLERPRDERLAAANALAAALSPEGAIPAGQRAFSYMTISELEDAVGRGFDIQLHTHTHSLGDFSPQRCRSEIDTNRAALASATKQPPSHFAHFCYPSGVVAPGIEKHLAACGIRSATTLEPRLADARSHPLRLPRILDGEHLSDVEFEAELCGLGEMVRSLRRGLKPSQDDRRHKASSRAES